VGPANILSHIRSRLICSRLLATHHSTSRHSVPSLCFSLLCHHLCHLLILLLVIVNSILMPTPVHLALILYLSHTPDAFAMFPPTTRIKANARPLTHVKTAVKHSFFLLTKVYGLATNSLILF
jgi:hypothetical protein